MLKQDPIRRRKLYEEVAARLEEMIRTGTFAVGDHLPSERELMASFGVGRSAVREALFALNKMGLIALTSGERARVVRPTPDMLLGELSGMVRYILAEPEGARNFQDLRNFFEVGLARHAATHATPEEIARLEQALSANQAAIADPREFMRTDIAFHYVLAEIPRNPIFLALHEALARWLTEQRATVVLSRSAARTAYGAHARIVKAIAARDPDRAEQEMRKHLRWVSDNYWKARNGADSG